MRTGRPPKTPALRRDRLLRVMTTQAEREDLKAAAARGSMDVSTWVRAVALVEARRGQGMAVKAVRDFLEVVYEGNWPTEIDINAHEIRDALEGADVYFLLPQIREALEIIRKERQ